MRLPSRAHPGSPTRERLDSPTSERGLPAGPNSWGNPAPVPRIGPPNQADQRLEPSRWKLQTPTKNPPWSPFEGGNSRFEHSTPAHTQFRARNQKLSRCKRTRKTGSAKSPSPQPPHPHNARLALRNYSLPLWRLGDGNSSLSALFQGLRTLLNRSRSPHQIRPADRDGRFAVSPNAAGGLSCVWSLLGGRRFRATTARSFLSESGLVSA